MSRRVRLILETRWEMAEKPMEGWLWPAPTKVGHVDHSSLKKQHARAFRLANAAVKERNEKNGTKRKRLCLGLYSFRHTFLTRLGQSSCDTWTLAKIAGHSSITISSRYVHPSEDAVLKAMSRLSGHKIGHSEEKTETLPVQKLPQLLKGKQKNGAPGKIRTCDLTLRRRSLYPSELRARQLENIMQRISFHPHAIIHPLPSRLVFLSLRGRN
jgi:hypothetical protein